jgi:peptidoglycan/xylan/chitin deacetylase (PgdA/CDA1 family)
VLTLLVIVTLTLVSGLIVVALSTLFHPTDWAVKRIGEFYPGVLFRVTTSERAVALTIDDAPHPDVTPGILRELRAHGARATFFIIGRHAEAHPDLVDAIRADGHELANHFYTDRMSARLSDAELTRELTQTDALIQPLESPRWCRAGSGVLTARMVRLVQSHGYTAVAGTAYPVDLYTNVRITVLHFLRNVRPGAVLVLHDGGPARANNVKAIAALLPRISRMGYRIVTLGELSRLAERI